MMLLIIKSNYRLQDFHLQIIHRLAVPVDPNSRDQIEYKEEYSEDICNFVKKHFTSLDPEPAICENCIYTVRKENHAIWRFVLKLKIFFSFQMSPDGHFILDYHSTHKNIVIGAGMSGKLHAHRIFLIMKVQSEHKISIAPKVS